jgi:hypothetical protein
VTRALAADGNLRRILVLALGTNGTVTAGQLRQLRRLIGPDRLLVLVSTYDPQPWEHDVNAVLAAASHASHTGLADWYAAIAARPDLLWPDGIHPRPAGAKLYAHVVRAAIQAALTSYCHR